MSQNPFGRNTVDFDAALEDIQGKMELATQRASEMECAVEVAGKVPISISPVRTPSAVYDEPPTAYEAENNATPHEQPVSPTPSSRLYKWIIGAASVAILALILIIMMLGAMLSDQISDSSTNHISEPNSESGRQDIASAEPALSGSDTDRQLVEGPVTGESNGETAKVTVEVPGKQGPVVLTATVQVEETQIVDETVEANSSPETGEESVLTPVPTPLSEASELPEDGEASLPTAAPEENEEISAGNENPPPTETPTAVETLDGTAESTIAPGEIVTSTVTETAEVTKTPAESETSSPTETPEVTKTPDDSESPSPTATLGSVGSKTPTPTATPTASETPTGSGDDTPTPTATPTATETPTSDGDDTPTPTATPEVTKTPTGDGENTPTPTETVEALFCTAPGPLMQEAEDAHFTGWMKVMADENASGGGFVYVSNQYEDLENDSNPNRDHRIDFCFAIADAGNYKVKVWVQAPEAGNNDSMYVEMDRNERATVWDVTHSKNRFSEDFVNVRQGPDELIFDLSEGNHLLSLIHREPNIRIDKIQIIFAGE